MVNSGSTEKFWMINQLVVMDSHLEVDLLVDPDESGFFLNLVFSDLFGQVRCKVFGPQSDTGDVRNDGAVNVGLVVVCGRRIWSGEPRSCG